MAKTPKVSEPVLEAEPAPLSPELGRTGLKGAIPYSGFLWEEILPELRGQKGAQAYRRMADNDPVCSSLLYAIESLLRGVSWTVEPNKTASSKEGAEAAADFVRTVLFDDMETSFGDVVSEALSQLTYGYAIQEIVLKRREGHQSDERRSSRYDDGYIGLAALAPRAQESIYRWIYSPQGRLVGLQQQLPDGGLTEIPVSRFLHFRTTARLANPEGRSLLRGAYVSFTRRNTIEQALGRTAVRSSGIVDIRVPGRMLRSDADPEDKAAIAGYKDIAERIAGDRQGGVILPSDIDDKGNRLVDFKFTLPDPRRPVELQGLLEMYNRLIAMTVLGDFLFLGSTAVGSRALADPKMDMFSRAMDAILQSMAEQFNRDLLPSLWAWNGFDFGVIPSVVPGKVAPPDLAAFAAMIPALVAAGIALNDPASENVLRQYIGLPPVTEESGGGEVGPGVELPPEFQQDPALLDQMEQKVRERFAAIRRGQQVAGGNGETPEPEL